MATGTGIAPVSAYLLSQRNSRFELPADRTKMMTRPPLRVSAGTSAGRLPLFYNYPLSTNVFPWAGIPGRTFSNPLDCGLSAGEVAPSLLQQVPVAGVVGRR